MTLILIMNISATLFLSIYMYIG